MDEIKELIRSSSLLISGVIFSGGEATMQPAALFSLAEYSKSIGLSTGLHTNGVYPDVIKNLIDKRLIDHIALDIKAEYDLYIKRGKEISVGKQVKLSLIECTESYHKGKLPSFEVVLTLLPDLYKDVITTTNDIASDVDLVFQQGIYRTKPPLSIEDMKRIADQIGRKIRIRSRDIGEIFYESNSSSGEARIRER